MRKNRLDQPLKRTIFYENGGFSDDSDCKINAFTPRIIVDSGNISGHLGTWENLKGQLFLR